MAGDTAIYGIVGENIGYSRSPEIFAALFRKHKIDAIYQRFDLGRHQLAAFAIAVRTAPIAGFNVTIPHKESVAELLKSCDAIAAATGAVNFVMNQAGKLCGYNTDYAGIAASIEKKLDFDVAGTNVAVVGSGGAARTVFYYLIKKHAANVKVQHHSKAREKSFSAWAEKIKGKTNYKSELMGAANASVEGADLVINCTPILIRKLFDKKTAAAMPRVFELRYGGGRKQSRTYVSGEYMLAVQACEAFRIMSGKTERPETIMRLVNKAAP
ncbi:MAG: hypothetical protein WBP29_09425 [Candidatus Zixiibacteriota bacterium]